MGFWYFLILFIGIALLVVGLLNKDVSRLTASSIACAAALRIIARISS